MGVTVRYCKDCRYFERSGWPGGYVGEGRCKLLNQDLPEGGDTPACSRFEDRTSH